MILVLTGIAQSVRLARRSFLSRRLSDTHFALPRTADLMSILKTVKTLWRLQITLAAGSPTPRRGPRLRWMLAGPRWWWPMLEGHGSQAKPRWEEIRGCTSKTKAVWRSSWQPRECQGAPARALRLAGGEPSRGRAVPRGLHVILAGVGRQGQAGLPWQGDTGKAAGRLPSHRSVCGAQDRSGKAALCIPGLCRSWLNVSRGSAQSRGVRASSGDLRGAQELAPEAPAPAGAAGAVPGHQFPSVPRCSEVHGDVLAQGTLVLVLPPALPCPALRTPLQTRTCHRFRERGCREGSRATRSWRWLLLPTPPSLSMPRTRGPK